MESWDKRYKSGKYSSAEPHKLLIDLADKLPSAKALDLACGTGRNANFLAEKGWKVKAVDNSSVGIEIAKQRSGEKNLEVDYLVADLEDDDFEIEPNAYDLICDFYYLQRDLFLKIKEGVKPGGIIISTIHLFDEGEKHARFVLNDDELREYFSDFEILHYYETKLTDKDAGDHNRRTAEIICRKPK
jgi:SAM-dependent methyltransferase